MEWTAFLALMITWLAAVVSPGPDFLTTVHVAATQSRRHGLAVAFGIGVATAVWAMAAILGLAALFAAVGWLYHTVQLAGAAYLIVMGLRMVRSASHVAPSSCYDGPRRNGSLLRAFGRGFVTDISNPKSAVFFSSLFAVALPPEAAWQTMSLVVAAVVAVSLLWNGGAALLLSRGRLAALYRRSERRIVAVVGLILVAFGIRLAAAR